jgi:hypothetical protein
MMYIREFDPKVLLYPESAPVQVVEFSTGKYMFKVIRDHRCNIF